MADTPEVLKRLEEIERRWRGVSNWGGTPWSYDWRTDRHIRYSGGADVRIFRDYVVPHKTECECEAEFVAGATLDLPWLLRLTRALLESQEELISEVRRVCPHTVAFGLRRGCPTCDLIARAEKLWKGEV